ncbi:hypothetical protein [Pilimelia columellifera]|uniref:Uncharacterized protein n=1 Tax=Pilimelia columellifera subsp. columellifera TaxID=706583 RepID=A0ABP6AQ52_9ACTN
MTRRGRLLLSAVAAAWAVVLLGLGYLSARNSPPTAREQRSVAQAAPIVDRAATLVVTAAWADAVFAVAPARLVAGCRLTTFVDGARLSRVVTLYTAAERGPDLLRQVAGSLPPSFGARVRGRGGVAERISADAGEFVAVSGQTLEPGVLRFTIHTGCRPASPDLRLDADTGPPPAAGVLGSAAALLGRPAERGHVSGDGATASTQRWDVPRAPIVDALAVLPGAREVVRRDGLVALRLADESVIIDRRDGRTSVAVSSLRRQ